MKWGLLLALGWLGGVGQLRAQPASQPSFLKLPHPHWRIKADKPVENELTAGLRAAWLAAMAEPAAGRDGAALPAAAKVGYEVSVEAEPPAAWPGPGFLRVQVAGLTDEVTIRLLNGRGRVVRRQRNRSPLRLAVGSLLPGRYFLLATDTAGQLLADCQCIVIGL